MYSQRPLSHCIFSFHVQECNDSIGTQETQMDRAGEHTHALLLDERLSIDLKRSRDDILVMRADWSARAASCISTARARSDQKTDKFGVGADMP